MPFPQPRNQPRAAVLERASGEFTIVPVGLDGPRPGELLVRLVATGICQTDLHASRQELPFLLPGVLGHEGAGVVEQVGAGIENLAPGDHVVLTYDSCGQCRACLSGHPPTASVPYNC